MDGFPACSLDIAERLWGFELILNSTIPLLILYRNGMAFLYLHMRHNPHRASWALCHTNQRGEDGLDITVRATGSPATPWWLSSQEHKVSWGFQYLGVKNMIITIAPMEQNLPVKNTLDTSTLIYLPMIDPCSRSSINTASIKFYCMSKKNKNYSARRYTWCLYSQPWVQAAHQSHLKY